MPTKKRKANSRKSSAKVTPFRSKSTPRGRGKKNSISFKNIFSLGNAHASKDNQNFNTSFVYGNLAVDLKSKTVGKNVNINFNIANKNSSFSGELLLNEKLFNEIQKTLYPVVKNIRKLAAS